MQRIFTLFFAVIATFSANCQTYIQDGDRCFDSGDYTCAVTNYDNAFKNTSGKDKQIAEIKLTRAKWCAEHLKTANQWFSSKNYLTAKDEYQKVLDSNPKDSYAQSQIMKCDNALSPRKLRVATTADMTDIWNNKYGIQPERRQNLINAGIDPDDAQTRINAGEGKPQEKEKPQGKEKLPTNLSVSKSNLYFTYFGETSEQIRVYSDGSSYSIPLDFVPSWCTVKGFTGYFTVTASANPNYTSRKDWIKVTAGDKEVRINVEQSAKIRKEAQQSSSPKETFNPSIVKKCFNCPKTRDILGLNLGYAQQKIDNYSMDVIQFGFKAEPLFKSGFGLNSGINILGYSKNLLDARLFNRGFDHYSVNIPLHLEYRLNFSKWFNLFVYGGPGINAFTDALFDEFSFPLTMEYGTGLRINKIQFSIGKSLMFGDLRDFNKIGEETRPFQNIYLSMSYMF